MEKNEKYWEDYTGLQKVKHDLLKRYLGGWFSILSRYNRRILYVDTHAGRGKHTKGEKGSPIVALERLLTHKMKDQILQGSEIIFIYFEIDKNNKIQLEKEVSLIGKLPKEVVVKVYNDDYEGVVSNILDSLEREGKNLAPSFFFIDPFGMDISMEVVKRILKNDKAEIMINFMSWRVDLSLNNPAHEKMLNKLYGSDVWKILKKIDEQEERKTEAIKLYIEILNVPFPLWIQMLDDNNKLKYTLIFATKHSAGNELMKQSAWAVLPTENFVAYEVNRPDVQYLFKEEPDLTQLKMKISDEFNDQNVSYNVILEFVNTKTIYIKKHLNKLVNELIKTGEIILVNETKFVTTHNPTLKVCINPTMAL